MTQGSAAKNPGTLHCHFSQFASCVISPGCVASVALAPILILFDILLQFFSDLASVFLLPFLHGGTGARPSKPWGRPVVRPRRVRADGKPIPLSESLPNVLGGVHAA